MKKKIFYLLIITSVALIFTYVILSLINGRKEEYLKSEKDLIQFTYDSLIEAFKVHSNIVYFNKINTNKVKNLLQNINEVSIKEQNKIRTELYDELKDMYENMHSFKLKQLHFHLKNNESFLRFHRPNKYGDNLTNIRATVNYVNTYNKPIQGFEEGRIYNGYRFVYPLNYKNKHIGSVETSVSMSNIIKEFRKEKTEDVDFIIKKSIVDTKVFKNEKDNYTLCTSTPNYYHEKAIGKGGSALIESLITSYAKENDIDKQLNTGEIFNFFNKAGENYYVTTFFPIKNAVSNDTVAYIIVTNRHNDFIEYKNQYMTFLIILIMLSALMTYFIYRIDKAKELLVHQDEILDEVQKIAHLGYWELDLVKNHLMWSDETYEIFGLQKNDFKETYESFLEYVHKDDIKKVNKAYMTSVKNKTQYSIEYRIITKTGEVKYVEDECHHTLDNNGDVIQSLGTVHDITQIKLYQYEVEKTKEQFVSLVSHMPDIVYRCENDSYFTMLYLNNAVTQITGYIPDELLLNKVICFRDIIDKEDLQNIIIQIDNAIQSEMKHLTLEYRIIRKDKEIIWVKDSFEILCDEKNILIEGVISDITAEKEAYNKLQKFIDTQDNIVILSNGKKIDFANKKLFDFFGFSNLKTFQENHACICELFIEHHKYFHLGKIQKNENWIEVMNSLPNLARIVMIKDKHNVDYVFSVTINKFEKDLWIVSFSDISETIQEQIKLEEKTTHDKLTGAYNREYFELSYTTQIALAQNFNHLLGIAILDIDYFKKINDSYGHDVGDSVLVELVNEIKKFSRLDDILIRWGGEEFLLMLQVKSADDLKKVLEHIRTVISSHNFKYIDKLTCSLGGTIYKIDEDISLSIKRADIALYASKANGRNMVTIE
ncbi:MAG: diguanylate cyclase [Arcobacteraceae bacterium]